MNPKNIALVMFSKWGDESMVEWLLQKESVDPFLFEQLPFTLAISYGHPKVVDVYLRDGRVNPNDQFGYSLRLASSLGLLDIVKLLLPLVDPAVVQNELIRNAVSNGHTPVVKLLLADDRVDASANENQCLHDACAKGYVEIVELLLAQMNPTLKALKMAVIHHQVAIVQHLLLDRRLQVELFDYRHLHHTTGAIIQLFLEDGRIRIEYATDMVLGALRRSEYDLVQKLLQYPRVIVNQRILKREMKYLKSVGKMIDFELEILK
jgi:hypothetical protein